MSLNDIYDPHVTMTSRSAGSHAEVFQRAEVSFLSPPSISCAQTKGPRLAFKDSQSNGILRVVRFYAPGIITPHFRYLDSALPSPDLTEVREIESIRHGCAHGKDTSCFVCFDLTAVVDMHRANHTCLAVPPRCYCP